MKVLLHFVGKSTYDEELFKLEAMKYGVNRALPLGLALKLRPGDIVLLAFKDKEGAKVFGYMIVEGYTIGEEIMRQLNNIECDDVNKAEDRGCGTIFITRVCHPKADWDTLAEEIKRLAQGKKVKIFVRGRFYEIKPVVLKNVKFTLSGKWVEVDWLETQLAQVVEQIKPSLRGYVESRYVKRDYTTEDLKRVLKLKHIGGNETLAKWFK
jgi:hypothetical protein